MLVYPNDREEFVKTPERETLPDALNRNRDLCDDIMPAYGERAQSHL